MIYLNSSFKKIGTPTLKDKKCFKDSYTKEELLKIYNEDYIFNLKSIIDDKVMHFSWHTVDELSIMKNNKIITNDSYLNDNENLAIDIMKNGTFWPILVKNNERELIVEKGIHRVGSAKSYISWDDRPFLCIEVISSQDGRIKDNLNRKMLLDKPKRIRLPILVLFPISENENNNIDEIKNYLKNINGNIIDSNIAEINVYNYKDLLRCVNYLSVWLRELIYKYNKNNPYNRIYSNEIINDKAVFDKWKAGNK